MKKIIGLIAVIALIVAGYFLFMGESPQERYVSSIDTEITSLETELETVDRQISNGILDPDTAAAARTQIATRLNALNTAVATTQEGKINDEQRLALIDGLSRFNKILRDYQTTILIVEQTALESENIDNDISLVDTLSSTIATFSEISSNIQNYFEESVPADFDSNGARDESSLTPEELEAAASSSNEAAVDVSAIEVDSTSEVTITPATE